MPNMRAKMQVQSVIDGGNGTQETVNFSAVTGKDPFGPSGESEDNTYARYTPQGTASYVINNPALKGQFKQGETYYVDFTRADK